MFFGEISLSGDIRPVPQAELRLKEAAKLGFTTAVVPAGTKVEGVGSEVDRNYQDVAELAGFRRPERAQRRAAAW